MLWIKWRIVRCQNNKKNFTELNLFLLNKTRSTNNKCKLSKITYTRNVKLFRLIPRISDHSSWWKIVWYIHLIDPYEIINNININVFRPHVIALFVSWRQQFFTRTWALACCHDVLAAFDDTITIIKFIITKILS